MSDTLRILTAPVFEPLLEKSRYKGARGGRGSGKSYFFADAIVESHMMAKTDTVCLREIQKSLTYSAYKLICSRIEHHNVGYHFDIQASCIKDAYGGIIIFNGLQDHTSESIKSLEGFDRAWVEEAQNISQRSLDILRPTIRRPGSEIWFSWNPHKEDDPIESLLVGDDAIADAIVVTANIDDNPWADAVLLEEMEQDRRIHDSDKFDNIWRGKYLKNTQGDYFKNEMNAVREQNRICFIPRLDIPVNTFWDIGNSDGCAVWFHQTIGMEDRFIGYYEAHGETLAHYARELQSRGYIYNKHFFPHDAHHERLSADNKSVKMMMEDLGLQNIEIVPRIDYLETGIQMVRKHFPTAFFDREACGEGVKRLDNYRKKYNSRDGRWLDEPNKANGCSEAADAFRQWAQAKESGNITLVGSKRRIPPKQSSSIGGRTSFMAY